MADWIEHTDVLSIGEKSQQEAAKLWERAKEAASKWKELPGGGVRSYFEFEEPFYVGMGSYGIVFRVIDKETKKPVALKLILGARSGAENEVAALLYIKYANEDKCSAELICYRKHFKALAGKWLVGRLEDISNQMVAKPDGRPVPGVDDTDWNEPQHFIATQFYDSISLETLMRYTKGPGSQAKTLVWNISMMTSAVGALEFMHTNKLYHRDLKPANVLVQGDESNLPTVVLIDVGDSCEETHCAADEFKGSQFYMPPKEYMMYRKERIGESLPYNYIRPLAAFDVYALGATFYDWMKNTTSENPLARGVSTALKTGPTTVWTLIARMIEPNDTKRITAAEAHKEFLQLLSIDWPFERGRRASTELKRIRM